MAAKLILSNSENFGFSLRNKDYYKPYSTYTIKVDSTIHDLVKFALDQESNYATMKYLNPWIRNDQLPNSAQKVYEIKFPKGDFHVEDFNEIDKLSDSIPNKLTDTLNLLKKSDTNKTQIK